MNGFRNAQFQRIFAFALVMLIFSGCAIEKRRHLKGYHISWNKSYRAGKVKSKEEKLDQKKDRIRLEETVTTTTEEDFVPSEITSAIVAPVVTDEETIEVNAPTPTPQVSKRVKRQSRVVSTQKQAIKPTKVAEKPAVKAHVRSKKEEKRSHDAALIAIASLMGLMTFGAFRKGKTLTHRIAKWSKKNKKTALGLVIGTQFGIAATGYFAGAEFAKLGMVFSDWSTIVSGALIGIGFTTYPYRKKSKALSSMSSSYIRKKAIDVVMITATFIATAGIGNHAEIKAQKNTQQTEVSFSAANAHSSAQSDFEADTSKQGFSHANTSNQEPDRTLSKGLAVFLCFMTVLLGLFLMCALCAISCWAYFMTGGVPGTALVIIIGAAGMAGIAILMTKMFSKIIRSSKR